MHKSTCAAETRLQTTGREQVVERKQITTLKNAIPENEFSSCMQQGQALTL